MNTEFDLIALGGGSGGLAVADLPMLHVQILHCPGGCPSLTSARIFGAVFRYEKSIVRIVPIQTDY